jgi:hypothetical protein
MSGIGPILWLIGAVAFAIFVSRMIAGDSAMDGDGGDGGD